MTQIYNELPKYPYECDMWDNLAKETRPIVVYGMGNGADKLIKNFEKYNIAISDFFASDGFVRGHSFHGMRVKSFSEIRERYPEFVIVLSFASNRAEVLSMLYGMDDTYEMYVPDMPVAGEDEYFNASFYNANYDSIKSAYESLDDEISRHTFASVLHYKLTGRMRYLRDAFCTRDEMYALLPCDRIGRIVDAGAYNGDTLREAKCYFPNLESAVAIEPDLRNFKKLSKYSEAECDINLKIYNCAAWSEDSEGSFSGSGNRNSSVNSTASYKHRDDTVSLSKIDTLTGGNADYIKYDVEGAEAEALIGSHGTIVGSRPALLVSLYHRSRDIFSIVNTLKNKYPFYRMYLRRLECVPAWEINLIAIPESE